jgi:hypothetical protein
MGNDGEPCYSLKLGPQAGAHYRCASCVTGCELCSDEVRRCWSREHTGGGRGR